MRSEARNVGALLNQHLLRVLASEIDFVRGNVAAG
jgi:hypothetical protein